MANKFIKNASGSITVIRKNLISGGEIETTYFVGRSSGLGYVRYYLPNGETAQVVGRGGVTMMSSRETLLADLKKLVRKLQKGDIKYAEQTSYLDNPAKRIGAEHPKRRSSATHAAPSARLVRRRKANVKKGYFPNPIIESAHIHGGVFPLTRHGGFAIAQQFRQNADSRWEGDKEVFRSHDKRAAVELVKFLNQHVADNYRFTVIDIL